MNYKNEQIDNTYYFFDIFSDYFLSSRLSFSIRMSRFDPEPCTLDFIFYLSVNSAPSIGSLHGFKFG